MENDKQEIMKFISELPKPVMVDNTLIENCKDGRASIVLCMNLSRVKYSNTYLAALLGIDKGHFTRILSGDAHFPTNKREELMLLCGNYAPLQYEAMVLGLSVMKMTDKQKEIIKTENYLKQLRAS